MAKFRFIRNKGVGHQRSVYCSPSSEVESIDETNFGGSELYTDGTRQAGIDEAGPQPVYPRSALLTGSAAVPYIGALALVCLAFYFPWWKGTWLFATVLIAWAIVRYFSTAMWYRRMAASSLALGAASAAIPSIVANWSSDKAHWEIATETSPWVAVAFVVAAVFFAFFELRVRRGAS